MNASKFKTMKLLKFIPILILFGCQSKTKELPILSYKMDADGYTTYYTVNYDNFTNQRNQSFTTQQIENKVLIANFFFTSCPSICPPMRNELIRIADNFKNQDDFLIVSHTIDPLNDTLEVLENYSETTGVSSERWQFLRSSIENTKKQAHVYMTNFQPNEDGTDFYHSSYVALIDKSQQIRGFYNLLVYDEVDRLIKDIEHLLN